MKRLAYLLMGALSGIAIASCGGGSSVAEGGIGGTGISSGSISAFSSIVVNGTKFDVDAAEITVNGDPATRDDLDIGYVVRVDGDLDDGVAEAVRFEADLIGAVDGNAIPAGEAVGTLTVMQQTVVITATTVLEGVDSPDTITDSDRVLVSGFRDSNDRLVATHLELNPAEMTDQVVGQVDATSNTSFDINGLVVNSNASPDKDDLVLVRGDYDAANGEFNPSSPIEELEFLVSAGTKIELEGIVDSFDNGLSDFTVGGVRVDADSAVIEDETGAPTTIQENDEVEVEGTFDATGTLVAERVEVELEDNVEIVARVANDPGVDGPVQFFNDGTPRLTVQVTDKTRLRDKSPLELDDFSVADLAQGDWVELDGFEDGAGNVIALKIERLAPADQDKVVVEGLVDSENEPVVEVLGMTFDATGRGFDFSTIVPGDTVEVEWAATATFVQPMPIDDIEKED